MYIVYAPKGKLGIVLENPDSNGPIVYIIKEMSPLFGKLNVGDRLIAVDEVDVRSLSPVNISKLINKRSSNPMRKLTLVKVPPKEEGSSEEEVGQKRPADRIEEITTEEEKQADESESGMFSSPEETPEEIAAR